jgi:hypothetical protein
VLHANEKAISHFNSENLNESVVLAIFSLSYCFTLGLVLAVAFVEELWSGHGHTKRCCLSTKSGDHQMWLVDWISFCFIALFPLLALCIALLLQKGNAWSIGLLSWYTSTSVLFLIFAMMTVFSEVTCAVEIVSKELESAGKGVWPFVKSCLLLKQTAIYSGYTTMKYVAYADSKEMPIDRLPEVSIVLDSSRQELTCWWSRFTKNRFLSTGPGRKWCLHCFSHLEVPKYLNTM